MKERFRELLRLDLLILTAVLLILFFPYDAEHGVSVREPQKAEVEVKEPTLIEKEEILFGQVMEHFKAGRYEKARDAARNYLKSYPIGKHYYEVYKVFKAHRKTAVN